MSVLDAYHAPYNKRHRYWTGLMLLTRCLLFLVFASSYGNTDPLLNNIYITAVVTFFIVLYKVFVKNVYRHAFTNVLEMCFIVNLEILSATLTFLKGSNSSSEVLCRSSNASISISFILFLLILTYHTYLRLQKRDGLFSSKTHSSLNGHLDVITQQQQKITHMYSQTLILILQCLQQRSLSYT